MSDPYILRSLLGKQYVTLEIPKTNDLAFLHMARDVVSFQIGLMIKYAEREQYADAEVASWCRPTVSRDGENERG